MSFFDNQEERALREAEEGVGSDVNFDTKELAFKYGAVAPGSQPLLCMGSAFLSAADREASHPTCPLASPQPHKAWLAPILLFDPSKSYEPPPVEHRPRGTSPRIPLSVSTREEPRSPRPPSPPIVPPTDVLGSSPVILNDAVGYLASDLCDILMLEIARHFYVAFSVVWSWLVPAVTFILVQTGRVTARKNAQKTIKVD